MDQLNIPIGLPQETLPQILLNLEHAKPPEHPRQISNEESPTTMIEHAFPESHKIDFSPISSDVVINGVSIEPKGNQPQIFYCVYCNKEQFSIIKHELGAGSWLWIGGSLMLLPCGACFPFCFKSCQDTVHLCPGCKREAGRRRFILEDC